MYMYLLCSKNIDKVKVRGVFFFAKDSLSQKLEAPKFHSEGKKVSIISLVDRHKSLSEFFMFLCVL